MDMSEMKRLFQEHVDRLADAMLGKKSGVQGSRMAEPVVVFFGDEVATFRSREDFDARIGNFTRRLRAIGMIGLRGEVLECISDGPDRCHVRVEWTMEVRGAEWVPVAIGIYYLTNPGEDFRVHLVSYQPHPSPDAIEWDLSQKLFDVSTPEVRLVEPAVGEAEEVEGFRQRLDALWKGAWEAVEGRGGGEGTIPLSYPLRILYRDELLVLEREEDFFDFVRELVGILRDQGAARLRRRITSVEFRPGGRFVARGEVRSQTPLGQLRHMFDITFMGRRTEDGFALDLIRLGELALPQADALLRALLGGDDLALADDLGAEGEADARKTAKLDLATIEQRTGTDYPPPLDREVAGRTSMQLGDAGGLRQFGVNLVHLEPGARSALRHWHEREDEFAIVLSGELVLVEEAGETVMLPGDSAAFPAGGPNAHCFVNRSERPAQLLVIGTRAEREVVHYPDHGLKAVIEAGMARFVRDDGTPFGNNGDHPPSGGRASRRPSKTPNTKTLPKEDKE